MATFEITRTVAAPSAEIYHSAHYEASAWDPFGCRIECLVPGDPVVVGNRVKIIAWHGQSMVVEYIQVRVAQRSAMKMIVGPRYLKSFAGTWLLTLRADGNTDVRWRYQLRAMPRYRFVERFMLIYFAWESRRRLAALAAYCEQRASAL